MSLYRQPGCKNWTFQIWTADRKRIRKTTETDDRAKAEIIERTFLMAIKGQADRSRLHAMLDAVCGVEPTATSIDEVWTLYTDWLKTSGRELTKQSLANRAVSVRRFAKWTHEHYPAAASLERVDRAAATAFATYLASTGAKGKTRQNIIGDLTVVWGALKRTRDGLNNPWPMVRPEANDSERGKPFTREQEAELLKAAKAAGKGWHLACQIARYTGLRYSSVARLKWDEVDLGAGVLRHTPPKTKRHNIAVVIPLAKILLDELKAARAEDPKATHVLPLHEKAYQYRKLKSGPGAFVELLKVAKVDDNQYTFHSWRHTFRTRLSEAGVADDLAKRLGGWTEDATAARYDHAERVEELRAAVEKAK